MTREELLVDIDRATSALASRAAQQNSGTGIPRPPTIEVSESSLETQPFNFELNSTSNAQAGPGSGGGGGPPPPPSEWACCHDDTCDDMSAADCTTAGGIYHIGKHCADEVDPCLPPCNGCGFDAFDMSGRKFLTKTVVTSWHTNQAVPSLDCTLTLDFDHTVVTTIDPTDCSETPMSTCSGTNQETCSGVSTFNCSIIDDDCDWNVDDPGCMRSDLPNEFVICTANTTSDTVTTATTETVTVTYHDRPLPVEVDCSGTKVITTTLSDECAP